MGLEAWLPGVIILIFGAALWKALKENSKSFAREDARRRGESEEVMRQRGLL